MKQKILSIALILCILMSLFAGMTFSVEAADIAENSNTAGDTVPETTQPTELTEQEEPSVIIEGDCGYGVSYVLNSDYELIFSGKGSGQMYDFKVGTAPWDSYRDKIKKVTMLGYITRLGDYSFYKCSNLTDVELPESLCYIGYAAFEYCSHLASISIPEEVFDIDSFAFGDCTNLTNVKLPKDIKGIERGMFYACKSLKSVELPESLHYIGAQAFYGCSALTNINLPDSVSSIGSSAFDRCSSLESVKLPKKLTSISSDLFSGCINLKSVYLSNNITDIGKYAFSYCESLKSINITDEVKSINYMAFYRCGSLESITIPVSMTTIDDAFYGCNALKQINYKGLPSQWKKINIDSDTISWFRNIKINYTYIDLSNYNVVMNRSRFAFDGAEKKPDISLNNGTKELVYGTDYTVIYSNNINPGTATATIKGIGDYSGEITKSFTIVEQTTLGDVDLDGQVTVLDATLIQKYIAEEEILNDEELELADTNKNGRVDIGDVTRIQLYLAQIITSLE